MLPLSLFPFLALAVLPLFMNFAFKTKKLNRRAFMKLTATTTLATGIAGGRAWADETKSGKIRFIGFTGHKDPAIHLHMLELAAKNNFKFDTVQMPLNVMDAHYKSLQQAVLPVLVRDKIGVLGMKSMGSSDVLKSNVVTPIECLHYALNLPTSVVITGCDSMKILDQAFEAAATFKPMSDQEVAALLAETSDAAKDGQFEMFKTSEKYDSTAKEPQNLS
jgi:hypothetical protein